MEDQLNSDYWLTTTDRVICYLTPKLRLTLVESRCGWSRLYFQAPRGDFSVWDEVSPRTMYNWLKQKGYGDFRLGYAKSHFAKCTLAVRGHFWSGAQTGGHGRHYGYIFVILHEDGRWERIPERTLISGIQHGIFCFNAEIA